MCLETLDENKILETLESLKNENDKLRDLVDNFTINKSKDLVSTLCSPIKIPDTTENSCKKCDQHLLNIRISKESHKSEIDVISKKLSDLECEKNAISEKYNNLKLETPSSEALVRKSSALDKEHHIKFNEIERLTAPLSKTNKNLNVLQKENDSLYNEVMENISEIDVLKNEQDTWESANTKLTEKFIHLERQMQSFESGKQHKAVCNDCALKDETINSLHKKILVTKSHSMLDRSYGDAGSSSRHNKICTLQNELEAGKEDCKELKEEVTTIKKQLEHSNLSISQNMDLDESIIDSQMYSFNKDFGNTSEKELNMSNVPERTVIDVEISDKTDCLNYYCEKTGTDKDSIDRDFKILEIMKMLYVNFSTKHANEIQNLVNKLKDFEEAKNENNLQAQINKVKEEQAAVLKGLQEKDNYLQKIAEIVSHIRNNISLINEELDSEDALITFRNKVLKMVDTGFGLASSNCFESIIQHLNETNKKVIERNTAEIGQLNEAIQRMATELNSGKDNLLSLQSQLNKKESEFAFIQRQKDKLHEINNAVTIDIINKEKELRCQVMLYYQKLLKKNFINEEIDLSLPLNKSVNILFNVILNQLENKKSEVGNLNIISELETLKTSLLQKDEDLKLLKDELNRILIEHEKKLKIQISLHDDLNKIYSKKVEENDYNANAINRLTEEINLLKNNVSSKDALIKSMETKYSKDLLERQSEQLEVLKNLQNVQKEYENLKSVKQNILIEKNVCAVELDGIKDILTQNKREMDKFVSEIDNLKQSVHDNYQVIENLKLKSDTLLEENNLLQRQLQENCTKCAHLEDNIKKHEKTAIIQTSIINRLQTQKADLINCNGEKDKQIVDIRQKCKSLEGECLKVTTEIQTAKEEIEKLSSVKQTLELRIAELHSLEGKPRFSIDSVSDSTRRRRQNIYDSKRKFADDGQDHKKLEALLESRTKNDFLMDHDENSASKTTPIKLSRGRDSLLSKHDQSYKDEEQSRPSRVPAARIRRRTAHDRHRHTETSYEPSNSFDGEAVHFKRLLTACREELEELKKRYKELDEECETYAEYLRERDEQCQKLGEAKAALETKLEEYQQSSIVQSVRKRRQTLHDQNRRTPGGVDVATDTSDDLLSYQVERDDSKHKIDDKEIKRLKMVVEKLSPKKASMEQQLTSVGTHYVTTASAIIQDQQLSDVTKKNHKLKKINAKLATIYKKRDKPLIESNIENEDPSKNTDSRN